jgi:hypothetical protein
MEGNVRRTSNVKVNTVNLGSAEGHRWERPALIMKIVTLNLPVRLKLPGHLPHRARDSGSMGIRAALTMTATLKPFVGTSIPQILQLTTRCVLINTHKILVQPLAGAHQQGMHLMMLL